MAETALQAELKLAMGDKAREKAVLQKHLRVSPSITNLDVAGLLVEMINKGKTTTKEHVAGLVAVYGCEPFGAMILLHEARREFCTAKGQ